MAETLKMILTPTLAGYAVEDGLAGIIRTEVAGGPPLYRRDVLGASPIVSVQWVVTKGGYDYLCAFKRLFEENVEPFLIDLIIGEAQLRECKAMLIPQSFRLQEVHGRSYVVTAQLDVVPPKYDPADDLTLIWLVGVFGPEWQAWINRLHRILNVQWPGMTNTPDDLWG